MTQTLKNMESLVNNTKLIPMTYLLYCRTFFPEYGGAKNLGLLSLSQRKQLQEYVKMNSVLISTRVNGNMTSLKLRTFVCALYCFILGDGVHDTKQFLMDACYRICKEWYGEDGKGLSGFVQDQMLRECLDREERKKFDSIVSEIEKLVGKCTK